MPNQIVQYTLSLKDLLTDKINQANDSVNKLEGSLGKVKGAAMSFGSAVGIAFGSAAVVAFGSKMIQAGTQVEDALTGLTTLLKDKAAAQGVINQTMEDATKTPFAFDGLLAANKALISAGVGAQQARTDVLNLANAIAATGGGDDELQRMVVNLQQIKNTGKATAQDIKQFAFAGVNIYKVLADATGQPIEKVKEMEISYDQLTAALAKASGEGGVYANGLQNMAGNTSVQISNLGDSIFQLSVQMFNDLKPAINTIVSGLATFIGYMRQGWEWLVKNKDLIQALAIGVTVAAVAWQAYLLVTGQSVIVTGLLTAAQWALNIALDANPIGLIIIAIGALTAGVMYAYNHFEKFRAVIWATWAVIKEFAMIVTDVFSGLAETMAGILTFDPTRIKEGASKSISAVADAAFRIGKAAKDGYNAGLKDFADSKAAETKNAPKDLLKGEKGAPGKAGAAVTPPKAETKGAQGQKVMNINISIGSLIKDFRINTTNMQEGAGKVREMVAQALLSATNDSQILAQ